LVPVSTRVPFGWLGRTSSGFSSSTWLTCWSSRSRWSGPKPGDPPVSDRRAVDLFRGLDPSTRRRGGSTRARRSPGWPRECSPTCPRKPATRLFVRAAELSVPTKPPGSHIGQFPASSSMARGPPRRCQRAGRLRRALALHSSRRGDRVARLSWLACRGLRRCGALSRLWQAARARRPPDRRCPPRRRRPPMTPLAEWDHHGLGCQS